MLLYFYCVYEGDGIDTKSRGRGWRLRLGGDDVGSITCFSTFIASMRVMELIQKAVAEDGGFALVWMVAPTVGKRVFLRVVSTIPTVMRGMTPSSTTVKKAAFGRSKSPAFAGTKTAADRSPSPNLRKPLPKPSPRGGSSFLLCFRRLCGAPSPWGRLGWGFGLGWGLWLGWGFYGGCSAPLATL